MPIAFPWGSFLILPCSSCHNHIDGEEIQTPACKNCFQSLQAQSFKDLTHINRIFVRFGWVFSSFLLSPVPTMNSCHHGLLERDSNEC